MNIQSNNIATIYGISLPKQMGFFYVKIIQTEKFGNMVRALDLLTPHLLTIEEFNKLEPLDLTYRMMMMGLPRTRKYKDRIIWHFVGTTELNDSDKIVPDFKEGFLMKNYNDWHRYNKWCVLKNMSLTNRVYNYGGYENIIHLPLWIHSSYEAITIRIIMLWLKKLNKNVYDFYTMEELEKDSTLRLGFVESKNSIFYSEIPKEKWNKFITN